MILESALVNSQWWCPLVDVYLVLRDQFCNFMQPEKRNECAENFQNALESEVIIAAPLKEEPHEEISGNQIRDQLLDLLVGYLAR